MSTNRTESQTIADAVAPFLARLVERFGSVDAAAAAFVAYTKGE